MLSALPSAVHVAAAAAERQRVIRRLVCLGNAVEVAVRHGCRPQCAPLAGRLTQCPKQAGRLGRMVQGALVQSMPELRLGQANQACGHERNLLAATRGLERGRRRGSRGFPFTRADQHHGQSALRLRHVRRRLCTFRNVEHRVGVGRGATKVALGDEAFRAQVEEIEPMARARAGCRQCRRGEFDRLRMPACPCEVTDMLRRRRRALAAGARLARRARRFLPVRIRHRLLESPCPGENFLRRQPSRDSRRTCASGARQQGNGGWRTG